MELQAAKFYDKAAARRPTPPSASCSSTSPRSSAARAEGGPTRRAHLTGRAEAERSAPSAPVRAAICAARPRRPHGRLGLDAGAPCSPRPSPRKQLGRLPGRPGRLDRRRHLHGLRRGPLGRRPSPAAAAPDARFVYGPHDGARRLGHTLPYPRPGLLAERLPGRHLLAVVVVAHLNSLGSSLDPHALHGYAVLPGRLPGGARRRA